MFVSSLDKRPAGNHPGGPEPGTHIAIIPLDGVPVKAHPPGELSGTRPIAVAASRGAARAARVVSGSGVL